MKGDDEDAASTLRLPSHHYPTPTVSDYFGNTSCVPTGGLCRCALDDDSYSCTTCDFCAHMRSLGCDECGFFLDLQCAQFILPDVECSDVVQIQDPFHHRDLTSFLATQEFGWDCYCALSRDRISEEDAYVCLHTRCKFLIHK